MNDFSAYKGTRCLVTGGTGMIGRAVTRLLCDAGAVVRTVSLDDLKLEPRALSYFGDLTDFQECKWFCWGVDYVFHVAGIKSNAQMTLERPASFFVPLLQMNTNVLEAARVCGVNKVVYVSSIGAYPPADLFVEEDGLEGEPMDAYPGWAKRMGEYQCQAYRIQYGLDWAIVRPSNVFGEGDNFDPETAMVIPALMAKAARGDDPVMVWGDGSAIRDFVYSEDVARGILLAGLRSTYTSDGIGFVNLGGWDSWTIEQLVWYLRDITGRQFEFDVSKSSGYPVRKMSYIRAKQLLGWMSEYPFRMGLQRTWEWFLENRDEYEHKQNYFGLGAG